MMVFGFIGNVAQIVTIAIITNVVAPVVALIAYGPGIVFRPAAATGDSNLHLIFHKAIARKLIVPHRGHQVDADIVIGENIIRKKTNAIYLAGRIVQMGANAVIQKEIVLDDGIVHIFQADAKTAGATKARAKKETPQTS